MTAACSCEMAGYCQRHAIEKSEMRWRLCQTKEHYRKAWDEHRLFGQSQEPIERERRKQRILKKSMAQKRLRVWCESMRIDSDIGLGDTMRRLLTKSRKRSTIRTMLLDFFKLHACGMREAVKNVNEIYAYNSQLDTNDP